MDPIYFHTMTWFCGRKQPRLALPTLLLPPCITSHRLLSTRAHDRRDVGGPTDGNVRQPGNVQQPRVLLAAGGTGGSGATVEDEEAAREMEASVLACVMPNGPHPFPHNDMVLWM